MTRYRCRIGEQQWFPRWNTSSISPTTAIDIVFVNLLNLAKFSFRDERIEDRLHSFTPIGIMQHTTVSYAHREDNPHPSIAQSGRLDLSGPACTIRTGRAETIHTRSDVHANHAIRSRACLLEQVQNSKLLRPNGSDSQAAKPWFTGIEAKINIDNEDESFSENLYQTVLSADVATYRKFSKKKDKLIDRRGRTN